MLLLGCRQVFQSFPNNKFKSCIFNKFEIPFFNHSPIGYHYHIINLIFFLQVLDSLSKSMSLKSITFKYPIANGLFFLVQHHAKKYLSIAYFAVLAKSFLAKRAFFLYFAFKI